MKETKEATMQSLSIIPRILLGLIFVVFGLNGFFHFLKVPAVPVSAQNYLSCLFSAPYFLYLVKGSEVFFGFLLLWGLWIGFALVGLAPIVINIFLFHFFLDPDGVQVGGVILGVWGILFATNWSRVSCLFN